MGFTLTLLLRQMKTDSAEEKLSGPNNSVSRRCSITNMKKPGTKKKTGLRKNPSAPKRFKSSYILFFIHVQKKIKEQLPGGCASAPEVAKKASEMWKSLSTREREYWDREAEKEKKRYMSEKAAYTGDWQVPHKRAKKDPSAPKRNPSAFLLFSQSKRKILKANNPSLKNTDISRVLGDMWRKTSDEEKRPHLERESREREKYKEDMSQWKEEQQVRKKAEMKVHNDKQLVVETEHDLRFDHPQTIHQQQQNVKQEHNHPGHPSNLFLPIPPTPCRASGQSQQDIYTNYFSREDSDGWHSPPPPSTQNESANPYNPHTPHIATTSPTISSSAFPTTTISSSSDNQEPMNYMPTASQQQQQSTPNYIPSQHQYLSPPISMPQVYESNHDNHGIYKPQCQQPNLGIPSLSTSNSTHHHPNHHHEEHSTYSMATTTTANNTTTTSSSGMGVYPRIEQSSISYYDHGPRHNNSSSNGITTASHNNNGGGTSSLLSRHHCDSPPYTYNNPDYEPVSFQNCESFDSIRDDFETVPIS